MTPARWTFVVVFSLSVLLGLGIGISALVSPDSADLTLNGAPVAGMTAFWTALLSAAIPGIILGLIAAGIAALFTRRKKDA
ncbi:MAG TPA: hypothetical protein VL133_15310 [Devosia sp.]|nr:hypothetical protein [Devosia sp.]